VVELAEAQRVEHRDRTRSHREDVAQDAADAGGGALDGLDRAGAVAALHLGRQAVAVPDVDHAGVLAWTLQDVRPRRREAPQQRTRVLVTAVLAPQGAEDPRFERVRLAPHALDHLVELLEAQPEARCQVPEAGGRLTGALRTVVPMFAHAVTLVESTWAPSTVRPSTDPSRASTAPSGCGIMPRTFPRALTIPAMERSLPLMFASAVTAPVSSQ